MGNKSDKASGLWIKSDGIVEEVTFSKKKVTLKEMQDAVQGYIEFVWLDDNKILVVNEDGKILGLPENIRATLMIKDQGIDDHIVGNALLIDLKYVD
jgi:hypothetical protein